MYSTDRPPGGRWTAFGASISSHDADGERVYECSGDDGCGACPVRAYASRSRSSSFSRSRVTRTAARPIGTGAWSYFGDPRAVHVGGRTFVGWADTQGYTHVMALDRNRVIEHQRLGPPLSIDDHNNPSLYVRERRPDHGLLLGPQRQDDVLPGLGTAALDHSLLGTARARREHQRADGLHVPESAARRRPAVVVFRGRQLAAQLHDPGGSLVEGTDAGPRRRSRGCRRTRASPSSAATGRTRSSTATASASTASSPRATSPSTATRSTTRRSTAAASTTRPGAGSLGSAARPPVQKLDRVQRLLRLPPMGARHRRQPVRPDHRVHATASRRPEFWWARFDGTKWLNFKITQYATRRARPARWAGRRSITRTRRSSTCRGSWRAGRDMTSRSGRRRTAARPGTTGRSPAPRPTTCGRSRPAA